MSLTALPSDFDYGFDLSAESPGDFSEPPVVADLPPSAWVNLDFVPPPGDQGACPSCCAWASVYGLVSFKAASEGDYMPNKPNLQASPAYIYIQVMQAMSMAAGTCKGSGFKDYFNILHAEGTPTLEAAPYTLVAKNTDNENDAADAVKLGSSQCQEIWKLYAGETPAMNTAFKVNNMKKVNTRLLDNIKKVLASGYPVAYGTRLYTDFKTYDGKNVPYIGNGEIWMNGDKPGGHCMMILGYDDNYKNKGMGAFLIQNSLGTGWGENGRVWMSYLTFEILAQGAGHYFPEEVKPTKIN